MMTGVFVITSTLFCLPQPLTGCGGSVICFAYVWFWLKKTKQPKTLKQATVLYISPLWNASEEYTFFLLLGHVRWSVIRFEQSCLTQSSQACWTGPWLNMTHTHTQTKPWKLFSTSETCCHPLYTEPTPLTQSSLPWCQSPRFRMDRTLSLWSVWSGSTCWLREANDADAWMASPQRDS